MMLSSIILFWTADHPYPAYFLTDALLPEQHRILYGTQFSDAPFA